ncbi:MAG: response regulator transcription factor [Solibacillus sp.]|uniref:response regulator transcription factor n=1 Tax=unclassified Solibacillus TaxID=2637870 RepID=UPI0030F5DFFC
MKTVLIVDDEQRMLDLIELFLVPQGFNCMKTTDPFQAIQLLKEHSIHILLLDVMMPKMDGWELCSEIRKFSSVPIIMLTARTAKADIIKGLRIGADDYLTKPFDEGELVARVRALLRRTTEENKIIRGDFILELDTYTVHYKEANVSLTSKEYTIVKALILKPRKVFTRQELLQIAWEYETEIDERTVDSHIRNLRDKLKKAHFPIDAFLLTVWGIGYKWGEE